MLGLGRPDAPSRQSRQAKMGAHLAEADVLLLTATRPQLRHLDRYVSPACWVTCVYRSALSSIGGGIVTYA